MKPHRAPLPAVQGLLFAAGFAWLLLGEIPSGGFWTGAVAIVLGIACMHGLLGRRKI